jgi:hypothetical protein
LCFPGWVPEPLRRRPKTQPSILDWDVSILTCCSWPNNWGIREACPNICRKERVRIMGEPGLGVGGWDGILRLGFQGA